jgi:hypothetical protein
MRIMVLHIGFKKSLALFPSVGLSDRSRYFVGFFVLKLNDELPLSTESILGHARILYDTVFLNTRYCVRTNGRATHPRALMSLTIYAPSSAFSRIRFQRVAESTGKEVPAEEIMKGYEVEKKARKRLHGAAQTVRGRAQRHRLQSRQKEREFGAPGFGKLVKHKRKAHTGINPKKQQNIKISAKTVIRFSVFKPAKDEILGAKK